MSDSNIQFPLEAVDDFKIYLPGEGFDFAANNANIIQINEDNRKELKKKIAPTNNRITASFIYAHPPDYRGRPMHHASVQEWRKAFCELKEINMDTVILQAALWTELEECFYNSKYYGKFKIFPVVEKMLEAAETEKMTVYLGGYGSLVGWKEKINDAELKAEIEKHRTCFYELVKLGKIAGMYFPCETAYDGKRIPEKERRMNTLYSEFVASVKGYDPKLKVITSPATKYFPGKEDEFLAFWESVIAGTGIDILMPQDSIGTCACMLSQMENAWKLWQQVAQQEHITLWSNTEIFERYWFDRDVNLFPANPERIAHQLALCSPYVEKHGCWEALYFASEYSGDGGVLLRDYLTGK